MMASLGLHDRWVLIERTQTLLQLAGEAIVQALEFRLPGLTEVEVGKQPPAGDRGGADQRVLDLAEPTHETSDGRPRNAIGQEKIKVLLLCKARNQALDCHESVRWTG
jgi:hypothetical protein